MTVNPKEAAMNVEQFRELIGPIAEALAGRALTPVTITAEPADDDEHAQSHLGCHSRHAPPPWRVVVLQDGARRGQEAFVGRHPGSPSLAVSPEYLAGLGLGKA
jgi:hypothetical protein